MPSIAELLEKDHREIDALFEKAEQGDRDAWAAFKERLTRHMDIEEQLLFPALADTPLVAPCRVMVHEHELLREMLVDEDVQGLPTCLGSHNNKEERVVYPACEGPEFAALTARVAQALAAR